MNTYSTLRNTQLGIDENDIKQCQMIDQLDEWHIDMTKQKAIVDDKLRKLKEERFYGLPSYDNDDFIRTKGYRTILLLMLQILVLRRTELKQLAKGSSQQSRDRLLVEAFREILPFDTFRQGVERMNQLLANN